MAEPYVFGSLTRISPLPNAAFDVRPLDRNDWATGDYVVGEVKVARGPLARVELPSGRMAEVATGDRMVGALGIRSATLEAVGDWRSIDEDLEFQALTSAGLFGRATSWSSQLRRLVTLRYLGHTWIGRRRQTMQGCVREWEGPDLEAPVILLVGTSMAAGKTTTAKALVRVLEREGHRVVGAKLTGAGRYRDILSMGDAGADEIFDFVDMGLPSTVCDEQRFRPLLRGLLRRIAAARPTVVVAEAGASPLEPYNGAAAIEELGDNVCCTILCASDPYAALGVMEAYGTRPDLITGIGVSTSAAIELVEKLTGRPALNLMAPDARPALRDLLASKL